MRTPCAAYFASVPPTANVSSSGCEKRHAIARTSVAAVVEQAQDRQEEVEQVEVDHHRGGHVVVLAVRARPHDAPRVEHEEPAEDEYRSRGEPEARAHA